MSAAKTNLFEIVSANAPARSSSKKVASSEAGAERRIVRIREACVECGACVGQCRTGALTIDASTCCIELDDELCSACALCVEACAFSAIVATCKHITADDKEEECHVVASQL